ncbi:MAG: carbohydrate ABC transporter substrate-binding protein [Chloroflexi bacterium]|nr:carbohydrate ABC transporter substrate-binding protein [Chloroflexota bacterium]
MFKRLFVGLILLIIVAIVAPIGSLATAQEEVTIQWWSHWANEPAKKLVIERIAADYEDEHPNVTIEITWWDKNPLRDAIRSSMLAGGDGAPDLTTFDSEVTEWVQAGWLLPLDDALPWDNFDPAVMIDGTYPNLGFPEHYKFDISTTIVMIFYNPEIFAELGIEVPEDNQFTSEEFVDVVQTCSDAGYAGVADAIGNRPYVGVWTAQLPLFTLVGGEEFSDYDNGLASWDTPAARQALEYSVELRDAGLYPDSFSTMTIDEMHVYFHTQRESCMFIIPTWYTGRAFKPVDEGGQDPDWHFGMLKYPSFENGVANDSLWLTFESGYAVLSSSEHPDVAKDILAFAAQPQYGALWTAVTNIPSSIKYDIATDWPSEELLNEMGVEPGKWDWYWEEYNEVYGDMTLEPTARLRCGDFDAAVVEMLNEGLPLGLVGVDDAIMILNESLCE